MERREFLKTAGIGTLAFTTIGFEAACNTPTWIIEAQGIAAIGVNIADQLVGAIDPAIKPLADAVAKGFNAVNQTLTDIETALKNNAPDATLLQNLNTVFSTLETDAAALLAAIPGSTSGLDTVVTLVIALLAQAIAELGKLLSSNLAFAVKAYRGFPSPMGWEKGDFKSRFNADVKGDSRFKKI